MQARIYKNTQNLMQSGKAKQNWKLEYYADRGKKYTESIMGWTASQDMQQEVILNFNSQEEAENFAKKNNIEYEVIEPKISKFKKKSYGDNFL